MSVQKDILIKDAKRERQFREWLSDFEFEQMDMEDATLYWADNDSGYVNYVVVLEGDTMAVPLPRERMNSIGLNGFRPWGGDGPAAIVFYLFGRHEWQSYKTKNKAIKELLKIKEFYDAFGEYSYFFLKWDWMNENPPEPKSRRKKNVRENEAGDDQS